MAPERSPDRASGLRRVQSGLRVFSLLATLAACVLAMTIAIQGFSSDQIGVGIAGLLLLAATATYAWVRYLRVRNDSTPAEPT